MKTIIFLLLNIAVALPTCWAQTTSSGAKTLERIGVDIDKKVLNPVRQTNATGSLTLTAFYSDGSRRTLRPSEAVIKARTKSASGNVEVVTIEGDKVVAKEGGIATIEAAVVEGGKTFTAGTDVIVAPFYRDYHQTLVLKLFLGMEGEPVERLAKEPLFQKPHDVICTFEEALEVIRKTDNLTRGIPKIVYLVGWQKGGHDHGYPSWSEVNPRMKRKQDATALESLRWLIREARQFNTTVSLHINMADAYKQSPLWDEYLAKDCIAKNESGQLHTLGIAMKGEDMYNVVYPREWEAGLAQRRIDGLIKMIPELKEGHTIHIDVFIANREGGTPISPWHAKPENGGLTPEKFVETQRKIFHYWRDRGFDVTGEGTGWAHPPGEHFIGLQGMSWWYSWNPMEIPECLGARGRTDRGGDGDFRFGSSMHGEEIYIKDKQNMPGFLGMFCRTTLPWYYLSRLERQKFENEALYYSDGVVARTEGGKRIIRKGEFVLREDDNLFVPALWNKKEIIAYSKPGYENKAWQLPDDWRDVKSVDLYRITMEGCVPLKQNVPVVDAKLVLSLGKDEAVSIFAAGDQAANTTQQGGRNVDETMVLENRAGVRWELQRTHSGWSLGTLLFHGKPVEQSATKGLLALRNLKSGEVRWLAASQGEKVGPRTARLSGQQEIDGVKFSWTVDVELRDDLPAANFTSKWSVDKDLNGWEVCLAYHDGFTNDWRVQSYPWAGNNEEAALTPMRYCGVPGVLVYRLDQSLVLLFAIDSNSDYLNPTTWSGKTGFHFANHRTAPQFRIGGGKLAAGTKYEMPLQLFLSDAGEFAGAITGIMQAWIKVNNYRVDDSLKVRTPQEAFVLALEGRRKMGSWKPGIGYEHHRGTPFVYVGNNPYIAYYEYRLHEITGEKVWRDRAFEQIDFAIKGQQPSGVFHTSWYFQKANRPGGATAEGFCSWDWSHNGYKVDINAWMVRYILQTWQRVKEKEGVDRQDWHKAAMASLNWVLAQQNPDGGFPQVVEIDSGKKSQSVVCGRALVGLPIIARITGDERYLKLSTDMERFMRQNVEGRFWYTGSHPDLPPGDFEQDSLYAVVEYWLDKHDRTGDKESLNRAVANAYYGLLYWCPKQLSWVKNPTQGAHSEQQHFNQYSVYCYGNRKIQCLDRLFKKTGNPLFEQLKNRVMQLNFYTQVTDGPYKGAVTEAIADPWLERNKGYEWRGSPYTSELVSDLMLQLIEMDLVTKP